PLGRAASPRTAPYPIQAKTGPVEKVVKSAMRTSTAKILGERTPRSRPIFKAMSSTRPRVFIRAPIAAASRQGIPLILAPAELAPNLPITATAITAAQTAQEEASFKRPT